MKVYRSPLRLFIFGVLGLFLIVAAIDVMFGHWLSEPPQNNDGVLTTRGQAQQRGDLVWGAALIGTGTLLVGGAMFDLVRRKPQCVVGPDGIGLAIGSREDVITIPWSNVRAVSAETRCDDFDGTVRPVLVVTIDDPSRLPGDPLGATWEGRDLVVEGHGWTKQIGPVASAAQSSLARSRRSAELMDSVTVAEDAVPVVEEEPPAPSPVPPPEGSVPEDELAEDELPGDVVREDETMEDAVPEDELAEDVVPEQTVSEEAEAQGDEPEDALTEDAPPSDAFPEAAVATAPLLDQSPVVESPEEAPEATEPPAGVVVDRIRGLMGPRADPAEADRGTREDQE